MRQTRIEFPVDGDAIDGIMCGPDRVAPPHPGVVVCHPHPLLGGSMDSPVVFAICQALAKLGVFSMRFDFRRTTTDSDGLQASAIRDTVAALNVIRQWDMVNPARTGVAGYSFGASTILRATPQLGEARAFALVAPAVSAVEECALADDDRPRLFVAGGRDTLVRADALSHAVEGEHLGELELFDSADHGFGSVLPTLAQKVAAFLANALSPGGR